MIDYNLLNKVEITKGVIGEFSKIREEFEELQDAEEQECKGLIMRTM